MGAVEEEADYSIKPENVTPTIPTSEWPLLLKNYDKCKPHPLASRGAV
jgi:H/ACA ribonucleoprotein complex subunit 4